MLLETSDLGFSPGVVEPLGVYLVHCCAEGETGDMLEGWEVMRHHGCGDAADRIFSGGGQALGRETTG